MMNGYRVFFASASYGFIGLLLDGIERKSILAAGRSWTIE